MTLNKDIRAQEGIPTSQSGSPTTKAAWIGKKSKSISKMLCSALSGNLTGVTLTTNHSVFNKWLYVKSLHRAQERVATHRVPPPPPPQKWPELAKKSPKSSKKCHDLPWQGTWQVLHWQPTIVFSISKCHGPLRQGTLQVLHWQPTTVFSINDCK